MKRLGCVILAAMFLSVGFMLGVEGTIKLMDWSDANIENAKTLNKVLEYFAYAILFIMCIGMCSTLIPEDKTKNKKL